MGCLAHCAFAVFSFRVGEVPGLLTPVSKACSLGEVSVQGQASQEVTWGSVQGYVPFLVSWGQWSVQCRVALLGQALFFPHCEKWGAAVGACCSSHTEPAAWRVSPVPAVHSPSVLVFYLQCRFPCGWFVSEGPRCAPEPGPGQAGAISRELHLVTAVPSRGQWSWRAVWHRAGGREQRPWAPAAASERVSRKQGWDTGSPCGVWGC